MNMKKLLSLVLSLMIVLISCDADQENNQDPQPVLPPEYSMAPDFNDFQTDGNQRNQTIENWFYAALNVSVYSAILKGGLAIPVAAFQATISQEPFYDTDEGVWAWESSFVANSNDFSIRLTADVQDGLANWKGYISSTSNNVEDFIWFEGQSNVNGNSGNWTLYESPQNPSAWLSTEWSSNEERTQASATFSIEKEGPNVGSYIAYSIDESSDLNRFAEISNTQSGDMIEVFWSTDLKFGRVKSETYFGDTVFHCWDQDFQDVSCTE
jgi:hypothetical protein